jgi:hypothetical protein
MRLTILLASAVLLTALPADDSIAAAVPPKGTIQRQNWLADRYKLTRLRDRAQLKRFIRLRLLVPVTDTPGYFVSPRHAGSLDKANAALYRHARPWVVDFLDTFSKAVNEELARPCCLMVTSLVRTKAYQRRLARANRYAAGRGHYRQSPHLTGATVDISLRWMPAPARRVMLRHLRWLQEDGAVDFIYERRNNCLHVFVVPDWREKTIYPVPGC